MEQRPFRRSFKRRHAKFRRYFFSLLRGVDLGQLVFDAAVADLEAFDLADPAFAFGLDDAGFEVVADFFQPGPLSWVRS
jgi:hypothetical protein